MTGSTLGTVCISQPSAFLEGRRWSVYARLGEDFTTAIGCNALNQMKLVPQFIFLLGNGPFHCHFTPTDRTMRWCKMPHMSLMQRTLSNILISNLLQYWDSCNSYIHMLPSTFSIHHSRTVNLFNILAKIFWSGFHFIPPVSSPAFLLNIKRRLFLSKCLTTSKPPALFACIVPSSCIKRSFAIRGWTKLSSFCHSSITIPMLWGSWFNENKFLSYVLKPIWKSLSTCTQ